MTNDGPVTSITSSGKTQPAVGSAARPKPIIPQSGPRCVKSQDHLRPRSPLGSPAAIAASSSPSSPVSLWDLFFFFGLSPLNLSFFEITPEEDMAGAVAVCCSVP